MKALLLVAHGSRKTSSNHAVKLVADKLREQLVNSDFEGIEHSFLELTEPSISQGVSLLVEAGAEQIVVMPYFLAPGTHVVDDVPELVDIARKRYPHVEFVITPHLGEVDGMIGLILQSANAVL